MPVARVTLHRTLVRGSQCANNQQAHRPNHNDNNQDSASFIDLSQTNHRNERMKQKYDHSGQLMYAYGRTSAHARHRTPDSCVSFVEEALAPECRATEWSPWSSCSVTCGHGIKSRRRSYLMPDRAFRHHCNERTYDMASCYLASCSMTKPTNHSTASDHGL